MRRNIPDRSSSIIPQCIRGRLPVRLPINHSPQPPTAQSDLVSGDTNGLYDVFVSTSNVLRNYPVLGHLRYMLEFVSPEIQQYFIETPQSGRPFNCKASESTRQAIDNVNSVQTAINDLAAVADLVSKLAAI